MNIKSKGEKMEVAYEVLFIINEISNIIVKCVALMAMHCYIIRGVFHGKEEKINSKTPYE